MTGQDTTRRLPRLDEEGLSEWEELGRDDELEDVALTGDFSWAEIEFATVRQSRVEGAAFTRARLVRAAFVDCVIVDTEWSGAELEECRFERVEFRHCRMSGVQGHGGRFTDVALTDCKVDGGNFRMSTWERSELRDSHLVECDFTGATMPGTRIHGCDLTDADLSTCNLAGSRLHRSQLEGLRGGDALRGVTIGGDQLVPAALAVFRALRIAIDDDGEP
jgi:uncharacterized protein YjbI with pentapeptide repeats